MFANLFLLSLKELPSFLSLLMDNGLKQDNDDKKQICSNSFILLDLEIFHAECFFEASNTNRFNVFDDMLSRTNLT